MNALKGKVAGLPLAAWLVGAVALAGVFVLQRRRASGSAVDVGSTQDLSGMPQAVFYSGQGTPGGLPADLQQTTPTPTPSPVGGDTGGTDPTTPTGPRPRDPYTGKRKDPGGKTPVIVGPIARVEGFTVSSATASTAALVA